MDRTNDDSPIRFERIEQKEEQVENDAASALPDSN